MNSVFPLRIKSIAAVLAALFLNLTLLIGVISADGGYIVPFAETAVEDAAELEDSKSDVQPLVYKFGTEADAKAQGLLYYHHGDGITEGKFTGVSQDGVSALKLEYCEPNEPKLPEYRVMFKFAAGARPTEAHKYMRVTYMSKDRAPSELTLLNNADRAYPAIMGPGNEEINVWCRSNAVQIENGGYLSRFTRGIHCTLGFNCLEKDAEFYISEVAFFGTAAQAYEYYGDTPDVNDTRYAKMTFNEGGSGGLLMGDTYGVSAYNEQTQSLDITYAPKTNMGVSYMAKIKFKSSAEYTPDMRYMRVLYSADNPDGITNASMYLRTDAKHHTFCLVPEIADTNGEFVLSDTALISQHAANRFAGVGDYTSRIHNSLIINTTKPGGMYSVKAVYFFSDRLSAEAFTYDDSPRSITVNGTDISKYSIVVSQEPARPVTEAAEAVRLRIHELCGVMLPIVTDDTPEGEYEILIGLSNREKSDISLYEKTGEGYEHGRFAISVSGNDVVITSETAPAIEAAAHNFIRMFLYGDSFAVPSEIMITDDFLSYNYTGINLTTAFEEFKNVDNPERLSLDFSSDDGYFTEENGADNWHYANGEYSVTADGADLSYIHVYEPNVEFSTRMKYSAASENAEMGLMLRYTAPAGWVKAGYDFELGEWFVESREGADFYLIRAASKKDTLVPGTWYDVSFTLNGASAVLSVNGAQILRAEVSHITPGRIAFFADNVSASFDDADVILLSGEGTVLKNVNHSYLYEDKYFAGGTVFERADGSLLYTITDSISFKSLDGGLTWQETEKFASLYGQPNFIRLEDGDIILIGTDGSDKVSFLSKDDGVTWTKGGKICITPYGGDKTVNAVAVNMNDKLFESPTTGRIFYCQNYESSVTHNGKRVFCEFYYSDDKGISWHKSETDSWKIEGNEKESHFGECKILECSDGTLRMYNSWNRYGCIVYSESTDNGVTWGPLVKMPEFACSLSSMQFVRDPWGETEHTYYMVWVYSVEDITFSMPRSRLCLAKSTDGKEWVYLGDIWRWESNYTATDSKAYINHIVNPFIYVTEESVFCGSGTSEYMADDSTSYHQFQRQNIWTLKKSTLPRGVSLNVFTDIKLTDKAYDAVSYVTRNGIFNGTSQTTFAPDEAMTRSMFVTVLGRLEGIDTAGYALPTFGDVKAGQWYTPYVEWAADNGIVNGIGNGLYGINGKITVEQACTILARYNGYKSSTSGGKPIVGFADSASVSGWAKTGVDWALTNGIYEGDGNFINPTSAASRADVAMMLANYITVYGE